MGELLRLIREAATWKVVCLESLTSTINLFKVGDKYNKVTTTTIEAATECLTGGSFVKPWGSQFISAVSSVVNDPEKTTITLLGDTQYLDKISASKPPTLR